ncbi:MAG TPA: LytR C-terminal domain-containing protein, partial [Acidimicrobiales bacterium]|nr:LytR C-terminal domain-containing protein [Acidimicrobiales bacterium]
MFYFTKGETPNLAAIDAANTANGPWYTPDSGGSYDGSGDLGRILRVHEFLKALAGQVAARGLGNLGTDNDLIDAVAPNLTVDSTFSDTDMVKLVLDYHGVDLGATPELTLPTINDAATYYYYGANYGDVIFPSEPQDQLAIDEFLGSKPPALALAPSSITVSVVDDTDSPATAAAVGSQLAAIGYQVVPTTVSNDVGPVAETTVLYDGPSHLAQAERVESSLHGAVVLGLGRPAGGADVSVVTGSVLSVARPAALASTAPAKASARPAAGRRHEGAAHHSAAPATTSTSAPAASVTAAPGTSGATGSTATTPPTSTSGTTLAIPTSTNPSIGAPTSANPGIPSYDPVTCPRIPS